MIEEFKNDYAKKYNYNSWSSMEQDLCDTNHVFVLVYRFNDMINELSNISSSKIKHLELLNNELRSQIVTNNSIK